MSSSSSTALTPDKDFSTPKYNYIRGGFFLVFAALSAFSPFASVLFESKGFTPYENGLLNSFCPLCTLFVIPPIAYLAEVNSIQSQMMYLSSFFSAFFLIVAFIAEDKMTVAIAACCFYIFHAPLLPLYDEHTMSNLTDKHKHVYGSFRLFGALSWLTGALVSSYVMGEWGWKWLTINVVFGFIGMG